LQTWKQVHEKSHKNDIIHVNLDQEGIIAMLEKKQGFVNRSHFKVASKNDFKRAYQAGGACFKP